MGQESEERVRQYLTHRKYRILAYNKKSHFGEIDLLVQNSLGQLVIIEIKSLSDLEFMSNRISHKQMRRLKNNREFIAIRTGLEVLLVAAYVLSLANGDFKIIWNHIEA